MPGQVDISETGTVRPMSHVTMVGIKYNEIRNRIRVILST